MESPTPPTSTDHDHDTDLRANIKLKQQQESSSMHMDPTKEMEGIVEENLQPLHDTEMSPKWGTETFSEALGGKSEIEQSPNYYMGEDDEEKFGGVDELFSSATTEATSASTSPREVEIPKDKYMSLFQPWRRALILKLLGKTVSFRVLQQRTADMWGLQWGYELIDIEHGFFLARFFSREDYKKVLEGGPRTIMGHYLTIAKWRPNFRPS